VSLRQRDKVAAYIRQALADGAASVAPRGSLPPRGWYLRPTVLASVDNSSRVAQEEVFGPVVCVIPFDGDAEAVRMADDSPYGLHGSVFTQDDERALAVARAVRTGTFSINGFVLNSERPFGGVKASGVGRKYGGRVSQLITGSIGLDQWEWGVTLMAHQVDALKEIVYEMRFDEVSARYAEFGPFVTGLLLDPAEALDRIGMPDR